MLCLITIGQFYAIRKENYLHASANDRNYDRYMYKKNDCFVFKACKFKPLVII